MHIRTTTWQAPKKKKKETLVYQNSKKYLPTGISSSFLPAFWLFPAASLELPTKVMAKTKRSRAFRFDALFILVFRSKLLFMLVFVILRRECEAYIYGTSKWLALIYLENRIDIYEPHMSHRVRDKPKFDSFFVYKLSLLLKDRVSLPTHHLVTQKSILVYFYSYNLFKWFYKSLCNGCLEKKNFHC